MNKSINDYVTEAHENALDHGWWDEPGSVTTARQVVNAYFDKGAIDRHAYEYIIESLEIAAERPLSGQIALIHSEASEALEEARNGRAPTETYYREDGKPEGIPSELADIVIRVFDTCGHYGIDLQAAIDEKMAYNKTRPYKHGGKVL